MVLVGHNLFQPGLNLHAFYDCKRNGRYFKPIHKSVSDHPGAFGHIIQHVFILKQPPKILTMFVINIFKDFYGLYNIIIKVVIHGIGITLIIMLQLLRTCINLWQMLTNGKQFAYINLFHTTHLNS